MSDKKAHVVLLGQTPPPWHGQAVATQILFEYEWTDFNVDFLRMDYSDDMDEVGRFQIKKLWRLFRLISDTRRLLARQRGSVLFYPPASAKWIPFLRDAIFLTCVRGKAAKTIFIYHASGLAQFSRKNALTKWLADLAYGEADMALEVAEEAVSPHETFGSRNYKWCPCGIDAPPIRRQLKATDSVRRVLFVGSLQEGKGVLEILKTADVLKGSGQGQNFRFDIVGRWMDTDFEKQALKLHKSLGLGDMVRFPGQLTGDEKWDAYRETDIFFFPTHYASEASPLVLMEALAAGLPVLTTAWNGIPALMKGCPTATLLPIKSPEQYAKTLLQLTDPSVDREVVAIESRKFYEDNFRPERFAERVAEAIRTVTSYPLQAPEKITTHSPVEAPEKLKLSVYLADQNPGHDRSLGISRMSKAILEEISKRDDVTLHVVASKSSQQGPLGKVVPHVMPWGTRSRLTRAFTDHFHPLFSKRNHIPDIHYYPKGYLPLLSKFCHPSVLTVHDTIIQYDEDHYPRWRNRREYAYWATMLKHTLRKADAVLTVSETSKMQIQSFMDRHGIPRKELIVTYEPCLYETVEQPEGDEKKDFVIHLASREPHKRTEHLIRWWHEAELQGRKLPVLHLIGKVPADCDAILAKSNKIVRRPFIPDSELQDTYRQARALILPSEIEGFGLPALEAYYLGTPVCFVESTSVEEILGVVTSKGKFSLSSSESLYAALEEVLAMKPDEIRNCGLKLREIYAANKVADRMMEVFQRLADETSSRK